MDRRMTRLFIENVSSRAYNDELEETFRACGRVTSCEVRDGSGYIEFENSRDAAEAIRKYDGYKINGKRISVEYAVKSTNRYVRQRKEQFKSDKEMGRCFKCKERGHIAKNCPLNQRSSSRSSIRSRSRSEDRKHKRKSKKSSRKHRRHSNSYSRSRSAKRKSKSRSNK